MSQSQPSPVTAAPDISIMASDEPSIQVVVRWCGTDYPMEVPSSDTVKDLKRKIEEVEGLPLKRQVLKDATDNKIILKDEAHVSSLSSPMNLVGMNRKDVEIYKKIFLEHKEDGFCHVTDHKIPILDFDGSKLGMSKGLYEVVTLKLDCLLKTDPIDLSSFQLMRNFKHPNYVAMENIFPSGPSLRLILLDSVDGTVDGWIKKGGPDLLFNSEGRTFSTFFSTMITELCDVLDKLIARKVCPKNLTKHNLYLKMVGDEPRLKVLFNNVEPLAIEKEGINKQLENLCVDIKGILSAYGFPHLHDVNAETTYFYHFLGKEAVTYIGKNLAKTAKSYPINWTDAMKSSYLIDLISSSLDLRLAINTCGIVWPKNEAGDDMCEELKQLKRILDEENNERNKLRLRLLRQNKIEEANAIKNYVWNYDIKFPYDLVRLSRNLWKHYSSYPDNVKGHLGGSKEAVLRNLERWCPDIWCLIYNAVGHA